jgi:hypothetical protein
LAIRTHRISCYVLFIFGTDLGARPPTVKSLRRPPSGVGLGCLRLRASNEGLLIPQLPQRE